LTKIGNHHILTYPTHLTCYGILVLYELTSPTTNLTKAVYSRIKDPKRRASSHSLQKVTVQWDEGQNVGCGTWNFLVVPFA